MSNPLKYTTSTPTGALRHATLGAGVANGEYDSTWRSGITPYTLTSYYLVYEPDSGGEVRVYAPADAAELIQLAQSKGSSETTEAGALTWLSSNGFYPANKVLDNIVTDGLVLFVDSTTATSYPRSGTTWLDLSGEGDDLTGTGASSAPTFDSTNSSISFDGNSQRFQSSINCGVVGDQTLEAVFYEDAATAPHTTIMCTDVGHQDGIKLMSYKNNNRYGFWLGYGSSSHLGMVSATLDNDVVYHLLGTYKSSTGEVKIYLNGELKLTSIMPTTGNVSLNDGKITLGIDYHGLGVGYSMNGNIFTSKVYDKVLTQAEVFQNYYQGPIVTDNLTFAIDASNPVSWEGTGNTLNNLISSTAYPTIALYGDTANYGSIGNGYVTLGGANNNTNQGTILRGTGDMGTTINNDFTTMGWQRRTSYVRSSGEILEYRGAWQRCSFDVGNGYMGFYQRETVAPYSTNATSTSISNSTLNEWNHFAVVKTSSTLSFYMNGKLIATNSYTLSETITGTSFSIGAAWSDDDYLSNGMDGDVGLTLHYTRALTADEVAQNYNANIKRYT